MSSATHYYPRYTIADYEQWEGDWELWDGYPIAMSPAPNVRHQRIARQLLLALQQGFNQQNLCQCEVLYEVDWRIADDTVLRPDLVVVCEPIDTPWLERAPTLIIEVLSPSTEKNDRQYKRDRYAKQGVAFYLIVDPQTEQVETLKLTGGEYRPTDPTDLLLHDGCSLNLDLSTIWG